MAQLLGSVLGGLAGTLLRSFSEQNYPSDSVIEVRAEIYAQQPVIDREECLALYGPNNEKLYDVVLHLPCYNSAIHVYSLYRSKDFDETSKHFHIFKNSIPTLIKCKEEFSTKPKLQNLCTLLREHPSWTSAHIAAHLGIVECFNHPEVLSRLTCSCEVSGQTALHVAVLGEKYKIAQTLLDLGVPLDVADVEGNTVFHFAAKTNKDMIQLLVNKSSDLINQRNIAGQTPLHIACIADKPDCVKALIYAGADVNATGTFTCEVTAPVTSSARGVMEMYQRQLHVKDMKHGGTPLHWAMSREVVEALVELGCQIDARDFKGDSALHTMILRSRLQCAIALLGYGADVNAANEELNTPLHFAVKSGNVQLIKALLVFGADVNMLNKFAESPRHIGANLKIAQSPEIVYILAAAGGKRCDYDKDNCCPGCAHGGQFEGTPKQTFTPTLRERHLFDEMLAQATVVAALSRKRAVGDSVVDGPNVCKGYRVLCLDGGGIRGLVLIQLLVAIEKAAGRPLTQCFDWISGTSTGGILALLIATGKSAKYCQSVYFRLKNKVFNGMRPYDSEPLEKFLQKELGENATMADVKHPKVAVTGVLADRHPAELHLFRNYSSPLSILGMQNQSTVYFSPTLPPEEQLMWRAARASGAAPTYFRALGRFVDGGLISNNPTLDMLTEIHEYNYALKATGREDEVRVVSCVVSLGTGKAPVEPVGTIDVYSPQSMWDAAKMAFGMSALGSLLVDQATCSDGRVVDRARAWCNMISVPYFRFNPDLSEDVALDETKDEILVNMLWETMLYMRSKKREISELISLLEY